MKIIKKMMEMKYKMEEICNSININNNYKIIMIKWQITLMFKIIKKLKKLLKLIIKYLRINIRKY